LVVDWCNGAKLDPFRDGMEVWGTVNLEDVDKKSNVVIFCDDGCGYQTCLVIGNSFFLFLHSLPFESSDVGSADFQGS
jgi:hypothetical protein